MQSRNKSEGKWLVDRADCSLKENRKMRNRYKRAMGFNTARNPTRKEWALGAVAQVKYMK